MSRVRRAAAPDNFYASVTDLVIGSLFIFIILLVSFAIDLNIEKSRLQERVERQVKARQQLLERVVARAGLNPRKQPVLGQGIIRLPQNTLFADNSAELGPTARYTLDRLARALATEVPCYTRSRDADCPPGSAAILDAIYIEGHSDRRNTKPPWQDNWQLSSARAAAVYQEVVDAAPSLALQTNAAEGTPVPLLGVSAYAYSRPVVRESPNAAENRRVDLRFTLVPLK